MAHVNIEKRRVVVQNLIDSNQATSKNLRKVSEEYNCSYNAVYADKIYLTRTESESLFISQKIKEHVRVRDKFCQYCGGLSNSMVIDHVIPTVLGGIAMPYNLVLACQKCNIKKRSNVVISKNFNVLASLNNDWANKIIELADKHNFDMRRFNSGDGRKTKDRLKTFRISASESQMNIIGFENAIKLAKSAARKAIVIEYLKKINK